MRMSICVSIASIVILGLQPAAAYAQWFPNPGLNAMSSSIQRDATMAQVRSLSGSVSREFSGFAPKVSPPPAATRMLSFKPVIERRRKNLAEFAETSRANDPLGAAQMQQLFAASDVIETIGQALAPFGLRVDNVADTYTVYLTNAWLGSRGRNDTLSKGQISAVRAQVANALLNTSEFVSSSDADKQKMSEAMLVQAALIEASIENAKSDPELMAQVRAAIAQGAEAMGLNLKSMKLTDAGFVEANSGSSIDGDGSRRVPTGNDPEKKLATGHKATPAPADINFTLVAVAGGTAIAGMFFLNKLINRRS